MTFEYTLLAGVNDGVGQAEELAALLRRHDLRSHVNLIPWNPVDDSGARRREEGGAGAGRSMGSKVGSAKQGQRWGRA